jgi:hypothetical protein
MSNNAELLRFLKALSALIEKQKGLLDQLQTIISDLSSKL